MVIRWNRRLEGSALPYPGERTEGVLEAHALVVDGSELPNRPLKGLLGKPCRELDRVVGCSDESLSVGHQNQEARPVEHTTENLRVELQSVT